MQSASFAARSIPGFFDIFLHLHWIKPLLVGIIFEEFTLAAPVHDNPELPLHFRFREIFLQGYHEK
jgi:hypothetical protein